MHINRAMLCRYEILLGMYDLEEKSELVSISRVLFGVGKNEIIRDDWFTCLFFFLLSVSTKVSDQINYENALQALVAFPHLPTSNETCLDNHNANWLCTDNFRRNHSMCYLWWYKNKTQTHSSLIHWQSIAYLGPIPQFTMSIP